MQTPPTPPRSPIEGLKGLVRLLSYAFTTLVMNGRLKPEMNARIATRITRMQERFFRIAEAVAAGTYKPRPERKPGDTPRKAPATPPKPPPVDSPFRKRGWMAAVLPADKVPQYRGYVRTWLQDTAMVALVEAAPVPVKRILRPLCWSLDYKPPPILALPKRPRQPRPAKPKRKRRRPTKSSPHLLAEMRSMPPSADWPPGARRLPHQKFG